MKKEEKLNIIKELNAQISAWFELRKNGRNWEEMHEVLLKISSMWGIASEILKSLNYDIEIEIVDPNRSKSIKPRVGDLFHDGIFSIINTQEQFTNMMKLQSYVISVPSKIEYGVLVPDNILPSYSHVLNILNSFSDVVSKMKYRRAGKSPLEINDEYDVQDILWAMLKGSFPSLQYEDPTAKVGPNSARADFTISDLGVFIETKFVGEKGREKNIHDECLADIQKYGKQESCQKIIFFIYDPNKCIDNQHGYRAGLGFSQSIDGKEVEIITLIFN